MCGLCIWTSSQNICFGLQCFEHTSIQYFYMDLSAWLYINTLKITSVCSFRCQNSKPFPFIFHGNIGININLIKYLIIILIVLKKIQRNFLFFMRKFFEHLKLNKSLYFCIRNKSKNIFHLKVIWFHSNSILTIIFFIFFINMH